MRFIPLLACAAVALLSSCTTCYNERFSQELIGKTDRELITLLGKPSSEYKRGNVLALEWAYDGTYTREDVVSGSYHSWKDKRGHRHWSYTPPYTERRTVRRVARMKINLVNGKAVSSTTYFDGHGMCNFFIPQSYIARYKAEDDLR